MAHTLRFQVIAIVVFTVATVLTASQWLDTRLSEGALERDLTERALLVLRTVDSLWGHTDSDALRRMLTTLAEGDREVEAIDIVRFTGGNPEIVVTTRSSDETPQDMLAADEVTRLAAGSNVTTALPPLAGTDRWRIAIPLERDGAVIGAVQVELWAAGVARLNRRLRIIDGVFMLSSITLISLVLALFLERRVTRPVAALVSGMQRAEGGELRARVDATIGGEFGFLAHSFNSMLDEIEDLTTGLEARVRRATQDLADKNRELRTVNEKLWQAQIDVGRSERLAALGQMAGTIAHELGTPLNSILGYTQLLRREALPGGHAEKLAIVESQVQRMIETMRSVLDRTRNSTLRRGAVAVAPLVAEALALVSRRLADREVVARSEVPADLPPVSGDAVGLRQALLNLLTNAIDATAPAGTITVSAMRLPGNGDAPRIELAVRDTGHGMSPEELRRVFEPFYTTKAPGRGTGLGLVIVDHIVRAHGGRLVVESTPGAGTTMRVQLPLEA